MGIASTALSGEEWASGAALGAALRDGGDAEIELVRLLMDVGGYMASDFDGAPPPIETLLARMRADYKVLGNLRILESEYRRVLADEAKPGRVVLQLIKLWLIDNDTGALSHGDGYQLSSERGGSFLMPSGGGSWEIRHGGDGYRVQVFTSANAAADRLTRWTNGKREQLSDAYRALQTLTVEAAPTKKGR